MQKNKDFYDFFWPFFLAKTRVWQKNVITMKTAIKNCVEIHDPMPKNMSDDPKTAIFHFFVIFLTEAGQGPKP